MRYEESRRLDREAWAAHKITSFTCGHFHAFVARCWTKARCLAFRGTQNIGNCLTDADSLLVSQPPYPGRVHCGFATAVEKIWPQVRELLGRPCRTRPLWLTGHSLGAAMATLASVRLTHEGYKVRAVYTYGSPRAGDRLFRDSYHLANYLPARGREKCLRQPWRSRQNSAISVASVRRWPAGRRSICGRASPGGRPRIGRRN